MLRLAAARRQGHRQRHRRRATARLEVLEARTVLSLPAYTLPLVNNSHLDPTKDSIYLGGFSQTSNLTLQPGSRPGVLEFGASTATVSTYKLGTGSSAFHQIYFNPSQAIIGARVYFFVVPKGQAPPSFAFGTQPADPPANQNLYTYVEITNPANNTHTPPTIDVSTVDGFSFPATLTLNNKLGEVGQPTASQHVNRQTIISEYNNFMAAAPGGGMYTVLELPKGPSAAGQSEGLLNPYFYLKEPGMGTSLPKNVTSPLNTVFDSALNTLFGANDWSLAATFKGMNTTYVAKAGTYQYGTRTNPYTGSALMLKGLQLQPVGGGNTFTVFNPVGVNQFLGADGQPITATSVSGALNKITLTNAPASGVLERGMYVFGAGFDQANGAATDYITDITPMGSQTVITLKNPLSSPVTNVQVVFSHVPDLSIMQLTSGEMVFGNTGFFADTNLQGLVGDAANTLGNLENQIVSAFNRGVAVVPGPMGPLDPSSDGFATKYWGTETNWYPAGQPENVFSLFLHTAVIKTDPIYLRPPNPVTDKNGALMGSAYGFAYDENPGPVPPAPSKQPEVPSKFDPVMEGTTEITITLDSWGSLGSTRGARSASKPFPA
jgi:hypothetical protein